MILVDIYIPALNQSFDFQVDETEPVGNIVVEVADMIGNRMKSPSVEHEKLVLCSVEKGEMIPKNITPQKYGMKNGCKLFLV